MQEPLAVVGLACRFPKGLNDPDLLWKGLCEKFDAIDDIPNERWSVDRFFAEDEQTKGKMYVRRGGFLSQNIQEFDAGFFGLSPREAEAMDPQQRLLLEVVWEAFENGGLDLTGYGRRQVGVYIGGFMLDHMLGQMGAANRTSIGQHTAAGTMMTMLSNRISHTFDFRGPSLSIDTACSSSLVAFHYACQDLWRGQCEMAIAGGVNVMTRPEYPVGMCKGQFLARDGRCKSFDRRGDGYGRGEGAGAVLIKTLSKAIADGDHVLATVEGTGANQDGRTTGISMPNGEAQQALIEQVCADSGIKPGDVRYVECHGTGTAIGDPTEAGAIGRVYGDGRSGDDRCVIGSVKSNIGHLEAAAGVAGVIKAVLTLQHRQAAPLANLEEPNPDIPFDDLGIRLADELLPLASGDERFSVAVNSFGYGGTNAHAILRSPPLKTADDRIAETTRSLPYVLPISARSPDALVTTAARFRDLLADDAPALDDLLYTAGRRRAHLSHRLAAVGTDRAELLAVLDDFLSEESKGDAVTGTQPYQGNRAPVFVYTGMGPQWWGMGQELMESEPTYRAAVLEADVIFQRIAGFSILDEMQRDEETSRITETRFAQPANLMVQIGLTAVLGAGGVQPGAIIGHSVGEVASAYAAGVLDLEEALTVSYHRSRLQQTAAGTGGMLAVALGLDDIQPMLEGVEHLVSIAAINGPTMITLAGDEATLERLSRRLDAEDVFNRILQVEVPYHSPMMDPLKADLQAALAGLTPRAPSIPLYSTVTGEEVGEHGLFDGKYWAENIRETVYFAKAIAALIEAGYNSFIEIGPHPVLSAALRDCVKLAGIEARTVETLRRGEREVIRVHRAIAQTYAVGCDIDWSKLGPAGDLTKLPNYPWQREKLWRESDRSQYERLTSVDLPMLGLKQTTALPIWQIDLEQQSLSYLREHVVGDMPVMPAAGYIECLLELASQQHTDCAGLALRDLQITAPLPMTRDRAIDLMTSYEASSRKAVLRSLENGAVTEGMQHVVAEIAGLTLVETEVVDLEALAERFQAVADVETFYQKLAGMGLNYGPRFQTIKELRFNRERAEVLARLELDEQLQDGFPNHRSHPTLLDGCFQTLMGLLDNDEITYLPTGVEELRLHGSSLPAEIWCHGIRTRQTEREVDCDLTLMDVDGNVVAVVRSLRCTAAGARPRKDQYGDDVKLQNLTYEWSIEEVTIEPKRMGHWLLIDDRDGTVGEQIAMRTDVMGATIIARAIIGDRYEAEGDRFMVRPGHEDDVSNLLDAVGDLDGVVFCHGLDSRLDGDDPTGEQAILAMLTFVQALGQWEQERRPRIYVTTRNAFHTTDRDAPVEPSQAALNAFVRVVYNEIEGLRCSTIDIDQGADDLVMESVVQELLGDADADEVALRVQGRFISELRHVDLLTAPRIERHEIDDDRPVSVRAGTTATGVSGTVQLLDVDHGPIGAHEIELRVEALLMPTNVLADTGSDQLDQSMIEVVGRIVAVGEAVSDLSPGERVSGYAPSDLASHFRGERWRFHLVEIDEEQPADKLVASLMYHARAVRIAELLDVEEGDHFLIYPDAMGASLAEIVTAAGAEVTLVNALEQQLNQATLTRFAHCPATAKGIETAVQNQTGGAGFDMIAAPMTLWRDRFDFRGLKPGGRLVDTDEVAKPIELPDRAGGVLRCDPSVLIGQRPKAFDKALAAALELTGSGALKTADPLSASVADLAQHFFAVPEAAARAVLSFDVQGQELPVLMRDVVRFEPNASYLITGGFGGFGKKTAWWMVENGARHLVLVGRRGADTDDKQSFVAELVAAGVEVTAAACDIADFDRTRALLEQIDDKLPPLRGVIHAAAVIEDQTVMEMDRETFARVMQSKATSALVLHQLTENRLLDHFILFSSVASAVGNSRQGSYVSANGFLDGLAWHRRAKGLPAISINWGAISDVGVVADDEKLEQYLRYVGIRGLSSKEGLGLLESAIARKVTQIGLMLITNWGDWARYEAIGSTSKRYERLIASDVGQKDSAVLDKLIAELKDLSPGDRLDILSGLIAAIVAGELQAEVANVPVDRPISELGVDSLMATEIQMLLEGNLGIAVSVLEILSDASIRTLAVKALDTMGLGQAVGKTG